MEKPIREKMAELRSVCERDIAIRQQRVESAINTFGSSLQLIKSRSLETQDNQVKLRELKSQLRQVEDQMVKALAVKTRKEAKKMALNDSVSTTKAKVEELSRTIQDQTARKDKYAAIISQGLEALTASEQNIKQDSAHRDEVQEAITWYNQVLGFRIEGGHGVKFTFTKINKKDPSEEYSFTVRHSNDTYTLLDCNPHVNDIKGLVHELNKTNGLFKFVRIMREKFQEAAGSGTLHDTTSLHQDVTTISLSAPVSSISTDSMCESSSSLQRGLGKSPWNPTRGRRAKSPVDSPGSASSLRRSTRFKAQGKK